MLTKLNLKYKGKTLEDVSTSQIPKKIDNFIKKVERNQEKGKVKRKKAIVKSEFKQKKQYTKKEIDELYNDLKLAILNSNYTMVVRKRNVQRFIKTYMMPLLDEYFKLTRLKYGTSKNKYITQIIKLFVLDEIKTIDDVRNKVPVCKYCKKYKVLPYWKAMLTDPSGIRWDSHCGNDKCLEKVKYNRYSKQGKQKKGDDLD